MPGSSLDLDKKSELVLQKWQLCKNTPSFDVFVEFAVCVSSMTEYLESKGLSGLHQSAHGLEQKVLSFFDQDPATALTPEVIADLDLQITSFHVRVLSYLEGSVNSVTDRRKVVDAKQVTSVPAATRICFVTVHPSAWHGLTVQLGFYNIQAELHAPDHRLALTQEPGIILIDAMGLKPDRFTDNVVLLRGQFSSSTIIGLNLSSDFETLKLALGSGCDYCYPGATAPATIMSRIVKLSSNEEEAPYRVLVVEDSKTATMVICRSLSEAGIESLAISRPQEVLTSLAKFQPDLVLMDMFMPGCTGVEVTRIIRQHTEFLSTPVVYLSAATNVALQVDALRLGGDHFLTKPFNPVILNAVVKSKIERYRALRRTMFHDSLTGLLNHITCKQRLDTMVNAAILEADSLCVAMVDIDHFKKVNDTYGHPMGDQVIRSMAWLLKQRLRKTDAVGRYGGEEFMVILPGSTAEQAFQLLDVIREDFSCIKHIASDTSFSCTFSSGVAEWKRGVTPEALISQADEMLYQSKRGGRNRVSIPVAG
jgi:diguanylate cyclase (GGDEF)-like protein